MKKLGSLFLLFSFIFANATNASIAEKILKLKEKGISRYECIVTTADAGGRNLRLKEGRDKGVLDPKDRVLIKENVFAKDEDEALHLVLNRLALRAFNEGVVYTTIYKS